MKRIAIACGVLLLLLLVLWGWRERSPRSSSEPASDDEQLIGESHASRGMESPEASTPGAHRTSEAGVPPRVAESTANLDATIAGHVELLSADAKLADVDVLAWPCGHEPSAAALGARNPVESGLRTAKTGSDGSFCLKGLVPGRAYTVSAAGNGCVAARREERVVCPTSDCVVHLAALFGVRFEFRDASGVPIQSNPAVFRRGWSVRLEYQEARMVEGMDLELAVLGYSPPRPSAASLWAPQDVLYVSSSTAQAIGPLTLDADLPGYAPLSAYETTLPRWSGTLPARDVLLTALADGWGTVLVEFVTDEGVCPPPKGKLAFFRASGEPAFDGEIAESASSPFELRGVPFGTYRVVFVPEHEQGVFPRNAAPRDVVVGPDVAELAVPLGDVGTVLVEIEVGGASYDGFALLRITSPSGVWKDVPMEGPTYAIRALVPGRYGISLAVAESIDLRKTRGAERLPRATIDVVAKTTVTARLALRE